jgi:hypothetical protein
MVYLIPMTTKIVVYSNHMTSAMTIWCIRVRFMSVPVTDFMWIALVEIYVTTAGVVVDTVNKVTASLGAVPVASAIVTVDRNTPVQSPLIPVLGLPCSS